MADRPLYPKLNPWDLEPHFSQHMQAMTAEDLHDKGAIAEQLAWRDQRIAELEAELLEARASDAKAYQDVTTRLETIQEKLSAAKQAEPLSSTPSGEAPTIERLRELVSLWRNRHQPQSDDDLSESAFGMGVRMCASQLEMLLPPALTQEPQALEGEACRDCGGTGEGCDVCQGGSALYHPKCKRCSGSGVEPA